MGYESRIFVVSKSEMPNPLVGEGSVWAELIAMYNMSCVDWSLYDAIIANGKPTNCYFYNGFETDVREDKYGKPLTEIPLHTFVESLEEITAKSDYRRYLPLLSMLKTFDERNESEWNNELVILHYGY